MSIADYESEISGVSLLDEGNTIPFIARYRKEMTGELDENELRAIEEKLQYMRNLEERKREVIRLIDEQGKLTDELRAVSNQVGEAAGSRRFVSSLSSEAQNTGSVAKERGLEPLGGLAAGRSHARRSACGSSAVISMRRRAWRLQRMRCKARWILSPRRLPMMLIFALGFASLRSTKASYHNGSEGCRAGIRVRDVLQLSGAGESCRRIGFWRLTAASGKMCLSVALDVPVERIHEYIAASSCSKRHGSGDTRYAGCRD